MAVFAGAVLGLWLIAALAVNLGAKSLGLIPMAWVRRITATILLALGIYTAVRRFPPADQRLSPLHCVARVSGRSAATLAFTWGTAQNVSV